MEHTRTQPLRGPCSGTCRASLRRRPARTSSGHSFVGLCMALLTCQVQSRNNSILNMDIEQDLIPPPEQELFPVLPQSPKDTGF